MPCCLVARSLSFYPFGLFERINDEDDDECGTGAKDAQVNINYDDVDGFVYAGTAATQPPVTGLCALPLLR